MTAQNIIDKARLALNDADSGNYRWPTVDLLGYVNDAIRELLRDRSDLRLSEIGLLTDLGPVALASDTVDLADTFLGPLSDFVAFRAFAEDSADTANAGRAEWHRTRWLEGTH